jgi:hypothetical protein
MVKWNSETLKFEPDPVNEEKHGPGPQCIYVPAYAPRCTKPARPGMQTCEEHGQTCYGCGERDATHGCTDAGGQFVCGAPLCDTCTHNGRGRGHGPAVMT